MKQFMIEGRLRWMPRHAAIAALAIVAILFPATIPARDSAEEKDRPAKSKEEFRLMGGFAQGILLRQQKGEVGLAFLMPNNSATMARDFQVTINWGDKTGTTRGKIGGENHWHQVSGHHAYAAVGRYSVSISVTGPDGTTRTATSVIEVGDLYAGDLENQTLSTFPASRGGETGRDFSVSIDWGDGTPMAAGAASRFGDRFRVQGSHAYRTNGVYTIRTLVTANGVVRDRTSRTVRVVPRRVIDAKLLPITYVPNQPMTNVEVAVFSVDNPLAKASDFGAQINWGDATPIDSNVTIVGGRGNFRIIASHTYKDGTVSYPFQMNIFQIWH